MGENQQNIDGREHSGGLGKASLRRGPTSKAPYREVGEGVSGSGNGKCKSPEAGWCLVSVRIKEETGEIGVGFLEDAGLQHGQKSGV